MAKKQQSPQDKPERFESDADRLVHRHLADKNHTITEEELQSIRIGHLSTGETVSEEAPLQSEDKAADIKADDESDTAPGAQKATPWDVLE